MAGGGHYQAKSFARHQAQLLAASACAAVSVLAISSTYVIVGEQSTERTCRAQLPLHWFDGRDTA